MTKVHYCHNFITANWLANCHCSKRGIIQIIRNPDLNKAHGHDMISICMLKLCGDSICQPLEIIFKMSLRNGRFPLEGKKPYWKERRYINHKKLLSSFTSTYLLQNIWTLALWHLVWLFSKSDKLQIILDSEQEILASISFFQLITKSSVLLIRGL